MNFGNVRRQGRYPAQLPLAHRSREIWGQLSDLIGDDCEFLPCGHLRLAFTSDEAALLEEYADQARGWNLELELLSRNALLERFPYLGTSVVTGSLSPRDGQANPRLVAPAFVRAARALGAKVHERSRVLNIRRHAAGFEIDRGGGDLVRAGVLINAAGAWGAEIAAMFGEPIEVVAKGPQMAVTEPLPRIFPEVLGTVDRSAFLRQVPRGNVVLSGGENGPASLRDWRAQSVPETAAGLFRSALKVVPGLRGANIIRCWSGVEGYTPDGLPVIGASVRANGLFHAFAFCGHGFQLGPGVGEVLSELVCGGRTGTSIEPFSIGRFDHPRPQQAAIKEAHA